MQKCFLVAMTLLNVSSAMAQQASPYIPESSLSTYYLQRASLFRQLPQTPGDVIFLGNSITDGGEWSEMFNDLHVKNRGISGDISAGVLNRLQEITRRKPARLFLMIGINDLADGISVDSLVKNILLIAGQVHQSSPATMLFIQSILPVNDYYGKFPGHTKRLNEVIQVNKSLENNASEYQYQFIDLFTHFKNAEGKLDTAYSNDGLHLTGKGYMLWKHLVYPYVYGLPSSPPLLPLPQQIDWKQGFFPWYALQSIEVKDTIIVKQGEWLQNQLQALGITIPLNIKSNKDIIEIKLGNVKAPINKEEVYQLKIKPEKIELVANTPHGIFNGLQTLLQLAFTGSYVNSCDITDWPSFSWRGYMVDVGRNYMSMDLLKEQIEIMSRYKMNVFHFHSTEDIAWRFAIEHYPQLTAPEHMLRNKGMYYTESDIKELIRFCKERFITFIPEIDMPGHSDAFKRAMKTDMQSDSGMVIVKNILKEITGKYDVPYIHLGADEVKITNKAFVPEVSKFLESRGRKIIGWQPGGNFNDNTIRQLWMDDAGKVMNNSKLQYIDSRHLYLNHMDPLESVVTIFNRQIAGNDHGSSSALGGTLCLWNDRAVAREDDLLEMNPVYPAMLTFAERSWKGGGLPQWISNISDGDKKKFVEFEDRLVGNKILYFNKKPFPYVKQSLMSWKLIGPFPNGGNLLKTFWPETSFEKQAVLTSDSVTGGTIVLRHWWAPLIKGAINSPEENTTWYASSRIWSNVAGEQDFWVGFNNFSRSQATNSPPTGQWDYKGSRVWVNKQLIDPPKWKHAAQEGNMEIPLVDEGFEFRQPSKIYLHKGWNNILIKAPVGSFKAVNWQNPVKWMFTFVPVDPLN
jgi:hexosaminidase